MILLIDHRDSFTRNLEHLLSEFGEVRVVDRKEAAPLAEEDETRIIALSPGPGRPSDYPETRDIYRNWRGRKPIIGVCLGFQLMLEEEGARTRRQETILHGARTPIAMEGSSTTYRGLSEPFWVGRYHSLQIAPPSLPDNLRITAWDRDRRVPLSFESLDLLLFGFQYHPESFLTDHGRELIGNVLSACLGQGA
ncbi:MAG: gamma-glutamyl-gamma-aminobutyrate hydrolase family protein, partial [Opitutales bacterium]